MAVAVTRLELDASDLRREATHCRDVKAARRMLALALCSRGMRARRRRGTPGWIGRRCATGCTVTTPRAWLGCATGRIRGLRRGSRLSS